MPALIPVSLLCVFYFQFINKIFTPAKRGYERLSSKNKAPIYSHFQESILGQSTIRAFKKTDEFTVKCMETVDKHSRVRMTQIAADLWLHWRLGLINTFSTVSGVIFAVYGRGYFTPGVVALVVTYAAHAGGVLRWGAHLYAHLNPKMVSLERIVTYANELEQEKPHELPSDKIIDSDWPAKGEIEFRNYTVRYRPELPAVIDEVSIFIQSGHKVGICGRTGAGKSSLMVALFRLIEGEVGNIFIDGIDIRTVGLRRLRSHLGKCFGHLKCSKTLFSISAIIPQEPILFNGTLRSNLDPWNSHTDVKIWDVIHKLRFPRTSCLI